MKKNPTILTKKEIQETFKKLAVEKHDNQKLQDWMNKSNNIVGEKNEIWIVADSSSSFINLNQEKYG